MRKFYLLLFTFIFFGGFSACTKDKDSDIAANSTPDFINLTFDASYADGDEISLNKKASLSFGRSSNVITSNLKSDIFSEYSVEEKNRIGSSNTNGLKSSIQKFAAKEGVITNEEFNGLNFKKLEEGVKFMVLIFDDEDNHIGSQMVTMGEGRNTPIKVTFKKDYVQTTNNYYRIVAFTYNTKDASDFDGLKLDPSQTNNNPQIDIPTDKEFFYYNGDFSMNPKNEQATTLLSLMFVPQTVKVALTVDGRGMDVKVRELQGVFKDFPVSNTYNFDLKLNRVTKVGSNVSNTYVDFSFLAIGSVDTLTVGRYIYLAAGESLTLQNFKVELNKLVIEREVTTPQGELTTELLNVVTAEKTYSFTDLNLNKGKFYNGRINLLTGFDINGIAWAYGNLYYDVSNAAFKIRNNPNAGKAAFVTDYWYQNDKVFERIVDSTVTTFLGIRNVEYKYVKVEGDPCNQVYPKGRWRMPTYEEAEMLYAKNATAGLQFRYDKSDKTARYVEYRKAGTLTPVLRFYGHGYYNSKTLLTPNLVAAFFINSYTDGSTSWGTDPRALIFTISKTMTTWGTASSDYVHDSGEIDSEDEVNDSSVEIKNNGANTDAITNYDDEIGKPTMNIRCVRTLRD